MCSFIQGYSASQQQGDQKQNKNFYLLRGEVKKMHDNSPGFSQKMYDQRVNLKA
jgi:hypothetical protein